MYVFNPCLLLENYMCVFQGGNTLGMLDSHHSQEVMSVEEHAARRREGREGEEEPSTSAPQEVEGEGEEYTSILLPVDSKERRVVLRRVSGAMGM